jgi:hypothetical protein
MARYLTDDLGAPLFDVALLARMLDRRKVADAALISPIPLFAQGWALLTAYRVSLPPGLEGLDAHITPYLWTLLDDRGVEQVKNALASGAIK